MDGAISRPPRLFVVLQPTVGQRNTKEVSLYPAHVSIPVTLNHAKAFRGIGVVTDAPPAHIPNQLGPGGIGVTAIAACRARQDTRIRGRQSACIIVPREIRVAQRTSAERATSPSISCRQGWGRSSMVKPARLDRFPAPDELRWSDRHTNAPLSRHSLANPALIGRRRAVMEKRGVSCPHPIHPEWLFL